MDYSKMDMDGRVDLIEGVHDVTLESVTLFTAEDKPTSLHFDFRGIQNEEPAYVLHKTNLDGKTEAQLQSQVFPRIAQVLNHLSGTNRTDIEKMFKAAEANEGLGDWEKLVKEINKYLGTIKEDKTCRVLVVSQWYKGQKYFSVPPFGTVVDRTGGSKLIFDADKHIGKNKEDAEVPADNGGYKTPGTAAKATAKKIGLE